MQYRVREGVFAALDAPLAVGSRVTIHGVPLVDGRSADLELEGFEVWAKGAKVVIYTDHGIEFQNPPRVFLYRGRIVGDPDSLTFVSKSEYGIHGYVLRGTRKFSIHSRARRIGEPDRSRNRRDDASSADGIFVDTIDSADEVTPDGETWQCDVDKMVARELVPSALAHERNPGSESIATATATYVLNIAVDTDHALYVNLSSSTSTVAMYVTQVAAASSTIYHRDLQTDLSLVYAGIVSTGTDPFTIVPGTPGSPGQTTFDALVQLGQVWHAAAGVPGDPRNINRSSAVLMSGKTQRAGTAWTGTMCRADFANQSANVPGGFGGAYAYIGGAGLDGTAVPDPNANPNSFAATSALDRTYWTSFGFTHELGHNVQSPHAHCVALSPGDAILYGRPAVDQCFSGEAGPSCYTNGTNGPVNANVPAEGGTIMSYCNLTTGPNASMTTNGFGTAVRYLFGKSGEASHVIVDNMKGRSTAQRQPFLF